MKDNGYSMLLMGTRNGETDRAAGLLDAEKFEYTRVPVANYHEPRLIYTVGSHPRAEVTGVAEIKDVIAFVKEELAKQAA